MLLYFIPTDIEFDASHLLGVHIPFSHVELPKDANSTEVNLLALLETKVIALSPNPDFMYDFGGTTVHIYTQNIKLKCNRLTNEIYYLFQITILESNISW